MIRHRNLKIKKKIKKGFYDFKIHYEEWDTLKYNALF